jgi:hypothetical protein
MQKISTTGFIDEQGKLQIAERDRFIEAVAAHPGTSVVITVDKIRNGISHRQRAYFYGVIVEVLHGFFQGTGVECTKDDVMNLLKDRFLFREQLCPITSKYMKVYISMSSNEGAMDMVEFTEKKEAIQRWGAEKLNLEIPDPDPNWRMYKKKNDET